METITTLLGWCLIINMGILITSTIAMIAMRGAIKNIHGKLFAISEADLSKAYFQYLANYKILVIVFNLVPYLALKIMGN
ncbi:MAG: hypothetical protein P1U89_24895 [Verrucomicrobiales bacterium]|nr:hypothetical protein [Verrucomicrobiales bacterium]